MSVDVRGKTDRFNLSAVGADFINACCFGEDLSRWLIAALKSAGIEAKVLCMEDFGWANEASYQGVSYLLCVGGSADGDPARPDFGEWRVMIERKRGLLDKLLGRHRLLPSDPLVGQVKDLLTAGGFSEVTVER